MYQEPTLSFLQLESQELCCDAYMLSCRKLLFLNIYAQHFMTHLLVGKEDKTPKMCSECHLTVFYFNWIHHYLHWKGLNTRKKRA